MIRNKIRIVLSALVLLALSACASQGGRLVAASDGIAVFDLRLDTTLDWARIKGPRIETWTIDGLPLNRFVVIAGVKPDEHVFLSAHARKRRPDGPWYRTGMRPDEIRDVILDALRQQGWTRVNASNLRPAKFGATDGLRFEASMSRSTGLIYKATFGAVERRGKLTHFFWSAPAEHYYDRDIVAVDAMFGSIRFEE